ncbi:MAG TPA: sterol desaturase family protein [Vicinamibacterales bacterium]|nr:sterol desaturase family protein [Vicinamibacterales bacterium]
MVAVVAFAAALVVGSFFEYVVHRLMHLRWVLGDRHLQHHRKGWGQGVLGEFRDYLYGVPVIGWLGFPHSVEAGIGFAAGCVAYAFFAGYSHQLNHERPELVFWLPRPVHHLHHAHRQWKQNFGIGVDIWDRLFGTYQVVEWKPERRPFDHPLREFGRIWWRKYNGPEGR